MGFLHNLWDETLAGPTPTPDSSLGKFRKYNSFSLRSANKIRPSHARENFPISRCNSLSGSSASGSSSPSPSGSTTPGSPFSPTTPGGNMKKLSRRKSTADGRHSTEAKNPTGYDWIVLSALDR